MSQKGFTQGSSGKSAILEVLNEWTNINPKKLNPGPNEPLLLIKPTHFYNVRRADIAIVKALYGRGKTYGFGYNLYHEARTLGDQEVIYVNAREVGERLRSSNINYLAPRGDPLDIIRMVCAGYYFPNMLSSNGIYLTTDVTLLRKVCPSDTIKNYLNKDSTTGLRSFLEDIAEASPKKLMLVIDEFEQVTTPGGRPDVQSVYNLLETLFRALRPGVLDKLPGKLGITLLIQELYYPTQRMIDFMNTTAYPTIGRLFVVNNDGSIPVEYDVGEYLKYMELATKYLASFKYISDKTAIEFNLAIRDANVRRLFKEYVQNMPALIAIRVIQELLNRVLSSEEAAKPEKIRDELESLFSEYEAYTIYGGKTRVAHGRRLANALAGLLREASRSDVVGKVERTGFEGAYAKLDNQVRILIARLSDVKDERSYRNELERLYGDILKKYCAAPKFQVKGQPEKPPCELVFLYLEEADVAFADSAIRSISKFGVEGAQVSYTYKPKMITRDDLFVMIVKYNEDLGVIAGDRRYVNAPERVQGLLSKIFMQEVR